MTVALTSDPTWTPPRVRQRGLAEKFIRICTFGFIFIRVWRGGATGTPVNFLHVRARCGVHYTLLPTANCTRSCARLAPAPAQLLATLCGCRVRLHGGED